MNFEMIDEMNLDDLTVGDSRKCYLQKEFTVRGRKFVNDGEGAFLSGAITVFHDQQDSTSWFAKCGGLCTGAFWAPQWAAESLFASVPGIGPVGADELKNS